MKIAIIGANSQVGTELCLLLRKRNETVIPIVRNSIGAAFLNQQGFSCRIADMSRKEDANVIADAEVIVIAAYMWPDLKIPVKQNKRINELIIQNAVASAQQKAVVIYFSSIRAFARKIDKTISPFELIPYYDKEKQHLEHILLNACSKQRKGGYAFRLGHVFGENQASTQQLKETLLGKIQIYLQVSKNKPSNIVHTITLAEAIIKCAQEEVKQGVYTLVNQPQWTWEEVILQYSHPSAHIICMGDVQKENFLLQGIKKLASNLSRRFMKHYLRIRVAIPQRLDAYLQYQYRRKKIMTEITELEQEEKPLSLSGFKYKPAPGPYVPNLSRTKDLLKAYDISEIVYPLKED